MINVELKGDVRQFEAGVSAADVAKSIGMGLYKSACAAKVNGEVCDLRTVLNEDCTLEILTFEDEGGKHAFWHTAAHVMAQAVQHLFPGAHFGIGPALENGWYYDIKADRPLTTGDFEAIEAEMKKIVKEDLPLEKRVITVEEGREIFAGQTYKLELLEEYAAKGWELTVYKQGDFTDLCAGPHLMSTGAIKAVKLTKVAAAYWRGDASRDSLDRLYGIAFPKASGLEEYLKLMEEAAKRDHRRLGKELEKKLAAAGIRVEADYRSEKMGYKIREAQLKKIPYMLVVGDKEMEDGTVAVRARKEEKGGTMSVDAFLAAIRAEIDSKER